ncbi:MAG: hypothetical protein JSS02_20085 [Planctomycetes bacterium]|nr:hypothetical protein [Planctomycetota bacterium]
MATIRGTCVALGLLWCLGATTQAAEKGQLGARFDAAANIVYPASSAVVDVTRPPYGARGDGITDDTDAIQRALTDVMGQHKLLYFPNGTYLVSRTLKWSKQNSSRKEAWGKNFLQGQNVARTIIRLKDATFTDPQQPGSIMWCGGFGSADWFHNYIQDITFDVGARNPAAIGLQFYSNNSGAVRNCRFVASAGSGQIGLDLGHRDMNGPLLVQNCEVRGFQIGICTAGAVNGQTFEHITLHGQSQFGFDNRGQAISLRGLDSDNIVPAVRTYGTLALCEAQLNGGVGAQQWPAVINYNGGGIFLRDLKTTGYGRAVGDVATPDWFAAVKLVGQSQPRGAGPHLDEYCSNSPTQPFPSPTGSLRLPIKEPPPTHIDEPNRWANVDDFGADPSGQHDSAAAIQRAMDSGATTVFLPGFYALRSTVVIGSRVRRIVGVGGWVDYKRQTVPNFRIQGDDAPPLCIEHLAFIHGGIEIDTRRTIVFRSVADCDLTMTDRAAGGELFFEDFVTHSLALQKQRVWARQLNVENEGTHVVNDAGDLWVLGYKTERGGTLLETRQQGRSEILGGFSYTTTSGKLAPMFVTHNSSVFTYFQEVCYTGDPFEILVRETRNESTVKVRRGTGTTAPYVSHFPPE